MYQYNYTTICPTAHRIACNLQRLGEEDISVTLKTTVSSGDLDTQRTIDAGPYPLSTVIARGGFEQLLGHKPNERLTDRVCVYLNSRRIGTINHSRFVYHEAPDVSTMIAYLAATDIGTERIIGKNDLDADAIQTNLRRIAKNVLPGKAYKNANVRLFRKHFREELREIRKQHQIWRTADGYLFDSTAIWNVCTRSIFGREIDVSTREAEMF